jgi:hypothetical protein
LKDFIPYDLARPRFRPSFFFVRPFLAFLVFHAFFQAAGQGVTDFATTCNNHNAKPKVRGT